MEGTKLVVVFVIVGVVNVVGGDVVIVVVVAVSGVSSGGKVGLRRCRGWSEFAGLSGYYLSERI